MGQFLKDALLSALNQTRPPDEIVISDNWSTDNTPELLALYAHHPVLRVIRPPSHLTLAENYAFAVNQCSGDLICILDADNILEREFLNVCVAAFQQCRDIAFCTTGRWEIDEQGNIIGRSGLSYPGQLLQFPRSVKYFMKGCRYTISATLWKAGPLKRWLAECKDLAVAIDWFLALTVATEGSVRFIQRPLIRYRFHSGSTSRSNTDRWTYDMYIMCRQLHKLWAHDPTLAPVIRGLCRKIAKGFLAGRQYDQLQPNQASELWNFFQSYLTPFERTSVGRAWLVSQHKFQEHLSAMKGIIKRLWCMKGLR